MAGCAHVTATAAAAVNAVANVFAACGDEASETMMQWKDAGISGLLPGLCVCSLPVLAVHHSTSPVAL